MISWHLIPIAAVLGAGCTGAAPERTPSTLPSHEVAREAILRHSIIQVQAQHVCLAAGSATVTGTSPLPRDDTLTILAELGPLHADPSPELLADLADLDVVPFSRCPEPEVNPNWWHLTSGPLRILGPTNVEMVVSLNLDGFPEVSVCSARLDRSTWRVDDCTLVFEA
jgi:hypothetical protein